VALNELGGVLAEAGDLKPRASASSKVWKSING
jgi:hypothetical protein